MHADAGPGVHLRRTAENAAAISALTTQLGGAAGLDGVLADLNRRGRRSVGLLGRAVEAAFTWDAEDRRTARWWPQGISTSADATDTAEVGGRRVVAVSWYSKTVEKVNQGCRVTFLDLDTLAYRHVLLVVPRVDDAGLLTCAPLQIHAGGLVWLGPNLHVAATARGLVTCRLDDIVRVPDPVAARRLRPGPDGRSVSAWGYRYLLPVRFGYQGVAADGVERLRCSFISLDRSGAPWQLTCGEYGRAGQSTRLAGFPVDRATLLPVADAAGDARPVLLDRRGVRQMQGAVRVSGRYYLTVSHGPAAPGSVYVGTPGAFREHRFATPMGPEDLGYWPATDTLWSVTEHPRRRWVFSMRRSWFDER